MGLYKEEDAVLNRLARMQKYSPLLECHALFMEPKSEDWCELQEALASLALSLRIKKEIHGTAGRGTYWQEIKFFIPWEQEGLIFAGTNYTVRYTIKYLTGGLNKGLTRQWVTIHRHLTTQDISPFKS